MLCARAEKGTENMVAIPADPAHDDTFWQSWVANRSKEKLLAFRNTQEENAKKRAADKQKRAADRAKRAAERKKIAQEHDIIEEEESSDTSSSSDDDYMSHVDAGMA